MESAFVDDTLLNFTEKAVVKQFILEMGQSRERFVGPQNLYFQS